MWNDQQASRRAKRSHRVPEFALSAAADLTTGSDWLNWLSTDCLLWKTLKLMFKNLLFIYSYFWWQKRWTGICSYLERQDIKEHKASPLQKCICFITYLNIYFISQNNFLLLRKLEMFIVKLNEKCSHFPLSSLFALIMVCTLPHIVICHNVWDFILS